MHVDQLPSLSRYRYRHIPSTGRRMVKADHRPALLCLVRDTAPHRRREPSNARQLDARFPETASSLTPRLAIPAVSVMRQKADHAQARDRWSALGSGRNRRLRILGLARLSNEGPRMGQDEPDQSRKSLNQQADSVSWMIGRWSTGYLEKVG